MENVSNTKTAIAKKPPVRPEIREAPVDTVEAARLRAEAIRGHIGNLDEGTDDFYIAPESVPDGWTYEWKRSTVMGQEDPAYQVQLARTGWTPVPASRHPEMVPSDYKRDTIDRKGMILMERPREITDEVRAIDRKRARDQVRVKEQQLASAPDGTMTRDHAKVKPSIRKSFEPMPIPDDDK